MTERLFIVVTEKPDRNGMLQDTHMEQKVSLNGATALVGQIAIHPEDPRRVVRVFSVDEHGVVEFFEVVFKDGKLKLVSKGVNL